LKITIHNKTDFFTRAIRDITIYDGYMIITWNIALQNLTHALTEFIWSKIR